MRRERLSDFYEVVMLHKVKKVEYLENYKLRLHFDDRSIKTVDLNLRKAETQAARLAWFNKTSMTKLIDLPA
jgi:hypothetical protein